MALQTSGAISLNDIHIEAGGTTGTQCAINNSDIRGLIGKSSGAEMSFNEWYGAQNAVFTWDGSTTQAVCGGGYADYGSGYGGGGGNANWYTYAFENAGNGVLGGGSAYGWVQAPNTVQLSPNTTYEFDYDITLNRSGPIAQAYLYLSTTHRGSGFNKTSSINGQTIIIQIISSPYSPTGTSIRQGTSLNLISGSTSSGTWSDTCQMTTGTSSTYYLGFGVRCNSNPNGNSGSANATLNSLTVTEV